MRISNLVILAVAVIGLGCAKPEAQLVGKWQMDSSTFASGDAAKDAKSAEAAKSFLLEFKQDKTFNMGTLLEGTYTMTGHEVTMTATKAMGMDLSKMKSNNTPATATLSEDGKTLSVNENGKTTKFTKSS